MLTVLTAISVVSVLASAGFYAVERLWSGAATSMGHPEDDRQWLPLAKIGIPVGWILLTGGTLISVVFLDSPGALQVGLVVQISSWAAFGAAMISMQNRIRAGLRQPVAPWRSQWNLLVHWVLVAVSLALAVTASPWGVQTYILSLGFLVNWLIETYVRIIRIHRDWKRRHSPPRPIDLGARDALLDGYYLMGIMIVMVAFLALMAQPQDSSVRGFGWMIEDPSTLWLMIACVGIVVLLGSQWLLRRSMRTSGWWLGVIMVTAGAALVAADCFLAIPAQSRLPGTVLGLVLFLGAGDSFWYNVGALKLRRLSRAELAAGLAVSAATSLGAVAVLMKAATHGAGENWRSAVTAFCVFVAAGIVLRVGYGALLTDVAGTPADGYTPNSTRFNLRHDFILSSAILAAVALWAALGPAVSIASYVVSFVTIVAWSIVMGVLHANSGWDSKSAEWKYARTVLNEAHYSRLVNGVMHRLLVQDILALATIWLALVFTQTVQG